MLRRAALILLVAGAASFPEPVLGASPRGMSFGALRDQGVRAYRAKKYLEALDLFKRAAALKPDDAQVMTELALCYQQLREPQPAIAANRDAIRLASAPTERARRIRQAAYFNLGRLEAGRELTFAFAEAPTCHALASEPGCAKPVLVCGADGGSSGGHWSSRFTTVRFAMTRDVAETADDDDPSRKFWSGHAAFGVDEEQTRDRADAPSYEVTLRYEEETRAPAPGEADVLETFVSASCDVVHVDGCARRLGLSCRSDRRGRDPKAKPKARAVELTFTDD